MAVNPSFVLADNRGFPLCLQAVVAEPNGGSGFDPISIPQIFNLHHLHPPSLTEHHKCFEHFFILYEYSSGGLIPCPKAYQHVSPQQKCVQPFWFFLEARH